jgi:alpha-L-rhamnosidase
LSETSSDDLWRAQWIWGDEAGMAEPPHRYYYFRQTFDMAAHPSPAASLRVCADTRYRLWINGQLVGHGPARSDPAWQYYDVYEVAAQLRPGVNAIALLATHYGIGTCYSRLGRPGLLAQLEVTDAHDLKQIVATDATWKCRPAPYATGYDRMSVQLAYPEVYDAAREPVGWQLPGYDDADWSAATEIGPIGTSPWTTLVPRDIPLPYYRAIAPTRIIQINAVRDQSAPEAVTPAPGPDRTSPAEDMERATLLRPAPAGAVTYGHPALFTVAPQSGAEGVSVVLDFGREVSGFPILIARRGGGGRVDIGYSERLEADGTLNPARWGGCPVHYADRLLLRSGHQHYEPLDHRAFRYLRLDFYACPEPIEMLVEMRTSGYPVTYRGDFQCSDPLLTRIWEIGRYTTELCMDDGFMDCPWRERGQWLGDAWVEALVAAYAFGDTALTRKALLQYPQSQDETGWFRGLFPADPPFDNLLPTFCCLWPAALWDYFRLTADRTLLEQVWPNIQRLVGAINAAIDADGLVADLPGWVFVDWAPVKTAGQSTAVNAMAYMALLACARVARTLGYPEIGGDYEIAAHGIGEALNDLLWDNTAGIYRDGIVNGVRSPTVSEQSNILAALVGVADGRQVARILAALFDPERRAALQPIPIATPYFAFYLLQLLYREGQYERALDYTRRRWGEMVERGATTFWEQWPDGDQHSAVHDYSMCHAWSATPSYDLMAHIAGIRPEQPGWEELTVDLRPCHLTWLRAVVPTPRGDVRLAYHFRTDAPKFDHMGNAIPQGKTTPAVTVNLTLPPGTRAQISLPLQGIAAPTIRFNARVVWQSGRPIAPSGDKFTVEADRLTFAIIGGHYDIEIDRSETEPAVCRHK